jgi:cell wall-associated NlpC family hydrolase
MKRPGAFQAVLTVLCIGTAGLATATPAQAGRIADVRAQADRAWAKIQSDGQRLEGVVERSNGARLRLAQTEDSIRQNQKVLAATRINLVHAEGALSASLISAYKSPVPDPLEAALEAHNFGQVLEQFALLDRTNTYNASMLNAIRGYRVEIVQRRRTLSRERDQRRAVAAELESLQARIRGSVAAEKRRYRGLQAEVRQLIEARRRAEVAASRRVAAKTQALRVDAASVVVNDIGGVSTIDEVSSAPLPAPSSVAAGAVGVALSQLGAPYVPGGAAPSGFDCSGLVSWAYARAGHPGLPHFTGDLWTAGTRIGSTSELAPGDLVFFDGLGHVGMYLGGGQFVEAPHSGDVVKVSNLASRRDYIGAVRISG